MFPVSNHLRNYKGFRSSVPGTWAETNIYIFYYLTLTHSSWIQLFDIGTW